MMIDIAGGIILAVFGLAAIGLALHLVVSFALIAIAAVRRHGQVAGALWVAFIIFVVVSFIATRH